MVRVLASVVVLSTACGGLDNRPLNFGAVKGVALDCDTEGVIGIVGDASVRASPDGLCNFRLENLEPGEHELFVAPNGKKVALVRTTIVATQLADVGTVVGRNGAFETVRVSAMGRTDFDGTVSAPELPIGATTLAKSGVARIGPFPAGCFRLEVTVSGVGQKAVSTCLAEGEEQAVDVRF